MRLIAALPLMNVWRCHLRKVNDVLIFILFILNFVKFYRSSSRPYSYLIIFLTDLQQISRSYTPATGRSQLFVPIAQGMMSWQPIMGLNWRQRPTAASRQLYKNICMLFLFPVIDGKLSTGVNAIFNASCYG